jgi:HTH-type transcriptional regulator / antitoxin HigA
MDDGEPAGDAAQHGGPRPAPGEVYFELVRCFPLRPIGSDEELERARAVLGELLGRDSLDPDRADYRDVLAGLIGQYEEAHHRLPEISDGEVLRDLLESRGVTCSEVFRGSGIAVSTLFSILAGRRRMNRYHIEAMARYFKVSPAVFFRTPLEGTRKGRLGARDPDPVEGLTSPQESAGPVSSG